MNFAEKQSRLIAAANEVKNFEEEDFKLREARKSVEYGTETEKREYEELLREALYEKLYGSRRHNKEVEKLIAVLLATEFPPYVALAKQLESLQRSQYHEDLKQIDAMMIAKKRLDKSYGYTTDKNTILATYKEYKEAKQKSSKYNIEFARKAKKCGCAKKILDRAYYIINEMERSVPSLASNYSWKNFEYIHSLGLEETIRENMSEIEKFLHNSTLIGEYLGSNESRKELKR